MDRFPGYSRNQASPALSVQHGISIVQNRCKNSAVEILATLCDPVRSGHIVTSCDEAMVRCSLRNKLNSADHEMYLETRLYGITSEL